MSVRTWAHAHVKGDAAITAIIPAVRIIGTSAIVEGTAPPDRPFMVIEAGVADPYEGTREYRVGGPDSGPRVALAHRLTFWVHNEPGDYETVDDVIALLRTRMMSAGPDPGNHILECRFVQESEDLPDDGFGTITRFSRWQVVTSR